MSSVATIERNETREIILAWLKGSSGIASGKRVLLYTFGEVGYLGALEDDFVQRHHVESGRLVGSVLNKTPSTAELTFIKECGRHIIAMLEAGELHIVSAPRQYQGNVALFALRK